MKIERIEGKYNGIFGDSEIHLNTDGEFYIKVKNALPDEYRYDELPRSSSLVEIRKLIDGFCETAIRQKLLKKKLFICVGTSSSVTPYDADAKAKEMFSQDHWKMFMDGDGFYLSYVIMNVYLFKYKTIIGSGKTYLKDHIAQEDSIYGWKNKELYEIIDGNSIKFKEKSGRLMERRDALFSLKYTHEMDYDEKIHDFLKSVGVSIESMVDQVTNFFNVPPENLTQNILSYTNDLKLLS